MKITRQPEKIPAARRPNNKQPVDNPAQKALSDDDRAFLDAMKEYHEDRQYEYMRPWWENRTKGAGKQAEK